MQKASLEVCDLFRIFQARSDNQLGETQAPKLFRGRNPRDVKGVIYAECEGSRGWLITDIGNPAENLRPRKGGPKRQPSPLVRNPVGVSVEMRQRKPSLLIVDAPKRRGGAGDAEDSKAPPPCRSGEF